MSIRISLLALASLLLITVMASLSAAGHAQVPGDLVQITGVH